MKVKLIEGTEHDIESLTNEWIKANAVKIISLSHSSVERLVKNNTIVYKSMLCITVIICYEI